MKTLSLSKRVKLELDLENFKEKKRIQITDKTKASAVIFAITKTNNSYSIILNRRSPFLNSHPGQISFPGGKKDDSDKDLLTTALREWEEEMGETAKNLKFIAELDDLYTGTGFLISPFLCFYEGNFEFQLNQNEVESYFLLEIEKLNQVDFFELRIKDSLRNKIHYFDLGEDLLWGATCEIIYKFLLSNSNFNKQEILVYSNIPEPPFFNPKLEYEIYEE